MKAKYNNFNITSRYTGEKPAGWSVNGQENWNHHKITVYNTVTKKRTSFDFWASIMNPEIRKASELLSAFYCFVSDAISGEMSFEEFCREFGYDTDSRKAESTHRACEHALKKLKSVYDGDIYDLVNRLSEKYG